MTTDGEERGSAAPSPAPGSLKAPDSFLIREWVNGMNSGEERRERERTPCAE